MVDLYTDRELVSVSPQDAVGWMLEALRLRATGGLVSPPRLSAPLSAGNIVVTAGETPTWFGYRVYDTLPTRAGEQVVVAHDRVTGDVAAVYVGNQLGAMRTGALGGAAASVLGPRRPVRLGVVGAGAQAWAQVWAICGVLDVIDCAIASRSIESRERLAEKARRAGLPARAVDCSRRAVEDADVVVLATNSSSPVIDTSWLKDDVLVITLGPKQAGRAEFQLSLVEGASLVVTDSPDQLRAYDPPAVVTAAGLVEDVVDLAALVAKPSASATVPPSGRRVYLSVGLAGTEVHMLGRFSEQF